jgi:hypothetical protein
MNKLTKFTSSDTVISATMKMYVSSSRDDEVCRRVRGTGAVGHPYRDVGWKCADRHGRYRLYGTLCEVDPYDDDYVSQDCLDYAQGGGSSMTFDITNLYRKWYELNTSGQPCNYGVMLLKVLDSAQYQTLYSSRASSSYRPLFTVNYISHAGVEGWWQYESRSNGRSGTAHVDLFNGNLVYEHPDTAMNGNLMPFRWRTTITAAFRIRRRTRTSTAAGTDGNIRAFSALWSVRSTVRSITCGKTETEQSTGSREAAANRT